MRLPKDGGDALTPVSERPRTGRGRHPELEAAFGVRIRAARVAARISQTELGAVFGVSFQQVQKYVLGKDRVSASTLQGIPAVLGLHPGSFFDTGPMPSGKVSEVRGAMKHAEILSHIRDPRVLKQLLALARVLVDPASEETERPTNQSGETL